MCAEHGEMCHYADEVPRKSRAAAKAAALAAKSAPMVMHSDNEDVADDTIVPDETMIDDADGERDDETQQHQAHDVPSLPVNPHPMHLGGYHHDDGVSNAMDMSPERDRLTYISQQAVNTSSNFSPDAAAPADSSKQSANGNSSAMTVATDSTEGHRRKNLPVDGSELPPDAAPQAAEGPATHAQSQNRSSANDGINAALFPHQQVSAADYHAPAATQTSSLDALAQLAQPTAQQQQQPNGQSGQLGHDRNGALVGGATVSMASSRTQQMHHSTMSNPVPNAACQRQEQQQHHHYQQQQQQQ